MRYPIPMSVPGTLDDFLEKAGPYYGPKGGKYADPEHKVPWTPGHQTAATDKVVEPAAKKAEAARTAAKKATQNAHSVRTEAAHLAAKEAHEAAAKAAHEVVSAIQRTDDPRRASAVLKQDMKGWAEEHRREAEIQRKFAAERKVKKSMGTLDDFLEKAGGPYYGPKGGKYADPEHKVAWKDRASGGKLSPKDLDLTHFGPDVGPALDREAAVKKFRAALVGRNDLAELARDHVENYGPGKTTELVQIARKLGIDAVPFVTNAGHEKLSSGKKGSGGAPDETEKSMTKVNTIDDFLEKAGGPYIGPRGGKYADPGLKTPWDPAKHGKGGGGKALDDLPSSSIEALKKLTLLRGATPPELDSSTATGLPDLVSSGMAEKGEGGVYRPTEKGLGELAKLTSLQAGEIVSHYQKQAGLSPKTPDKTSLASAPPEARARYDSLMREARRAHGYMIEMKQANTEKSMTQVNTIDDFLEKAGAAGGLPTHEPKMGHGHSAGSADGGDLDGTGMTSGRGDSAPGPGTDSSGQVVATKPKKDKLSEDDEDDEKQMEPHKKPIERSVKKSVDGQYAVTPAGQREQVARDTAALAKAASAEDDVVLSSDEAAARLAKGGEFYQGESPHLTRPTPPIAQSQTCGSCGEQFSKALTAHPGCGAGTTSHRPLPSAGSHTVGGLTPDRGPGNLLSKARSDADEEVAIGGPVPHVHDLLGGR